MFQQKKRFPKNNIEEKKKLSCFLGDFISPGTGSSLFQSSNDRTPCADVKLKGTVPSFCHGITLTTMGSMGLVYSYLYTRKNEKKHPCR